MVMSRDYLLLLVFIGMSMGDSEVQIIDLFDPSPPTTCTEVDYNPLRILCSSNHLMSPAPAVSWFVNNTPLPRNKTGEPWTEILIRDNFTILEVNKVSQEDDGIYACKISNLTNIEWKGIILRISLTAFELDTCPSTDHVHSTYPNWTRIKTEERLPPEEQSDDPPAKDFAFINEESDFFDNVTIPANEEILLRCPFRSDLKASMSWFFENKNDTKKKEVIGEDTGMDEILAKPGFRYTCVVCNADKCHQHSFYVYEYVDFPPDPENVKPTGPGSCSVKLNETAFCQLPEEYGKKQYIRWIKRDPENSNGNITEAEMNNVYQRSNVSTPRNLTIKDMKESDAGWYTALMGNGSDWTSYDMEVKLEVVPPPTTKILAGVLSVAFVIALGIAGYIFWRFRLEERKKRLAMEMATAIAQWNKKIIVEKPEPSETDNPDAPIALPTVKIVKHQVMVSANRDPNAYVSEYEMPLDSPWELEREDLELLNVVGEGAFGVVYKAEFTDSISRKKRHVAVKMLRGEHDDPEVVDLVSEMEIMKVIGKHENIIGLVGSCTQNGPLYVVVELAKHGNLRDYLRARRPSSEQELDDDDSLTQMDLVSFAFQVAKGMDYLASKRCIHRDLAARNVLVAEGNILKICDFGLARDLHWQDYYRKKTKGRLPIKWMAPEALFHSKYTIKSDVWSFGILLWEIMTLGGTPYPSIPSGGKVFQMLRSGHRMEKPSQCSDEVYQIMSDCWKELPNDRPIFADLVKYFDTLMMEASAEVFLVKATAEPDTPPSSAEPSDIDDDPQDDNGLEIPLVEIKGTKSDPGEEI